MAAEHRPDLVLLDIYLPDMSGLEVLTALQGRPPVDVLMISAARDMSTVRAAMRGGVVNYLIKPFTAAALTERLEQYADTRRQLTAIGPRPARTTSTGSSAGSPSPAPLPKGLSTTCALVADALQKTGRDLSAAEAAVAHGPVPGQRPPLPGIPVRRRAGRTPAQLRHGRTPGTPLPVDGLTHFRPAAALFGGDASVVADDSAPDSTSHFS